MKIKISHNVIHKQVISIFIRIMPAVHDVKDKVNLCKERFFVLEYPTNPNENLLCQF